MLFKEAIPCNTCDSYLQWLKHGPYDRNVTDIQKKRQCFFWKKQFQETKI